MNSINPIDSINVLGGPDALSQFASPQTYSVTNLNQEVAGLFRNDRPDWIGIGGQFASEYASIKGIDNANNIM